MTHTEKLRLVFEEQANSYNAKKMSSYMRNKFEYFGLKSPERKDITKLFFKNNGLPDDVDAMAKEWWQQPEREFQYIAMEMLDKNKKKSDRNRIELYEYLIINKSWWDTIDLIAAKLVGYHFRAFPDLTPVYTEKWMNSGNFWLQRTCLLFQLKYKKDTDWEMMQRFIHELKDEKEFFIRKAIGWVLREYSKTYPDKVQEFIDNTELSNLSRKEGLKIIEKNR
ncbi:MAG: DNA alkylation repair protein [Bacteroidota bacterium]|nr:DNA alkylation repair protein [Bacteroidota bacterium]